MTVKDLKKLLKNLPLDLDVLMVLSDDKAVSVCKENSEVLQIVIGGQAEHVLLLVPCNCGHGEQEIILSEEEPNLN